ncbi:phage tail protein [uncultured Streptococcus sp.]|uniref:phage tail protein n=1 Tax=uncultured Streptococcus sp. TaxID=83427 RepID=UPI003211932C
MDFMIINGFNTSTIPNCYVVDFGEVSGAEPRGEVASLHGVNGSYRILDGSYNSYERTFKFYIKKLTDISVIVDKFQSNDNILEFSYHPESVFYANFLTATYKPNGNHAWELTIKLTMQPFRYPKSVAPVVLTSAGTIDNIGTVYSEPVLEIEGDGDVSITIGNKTMYLSLKNKATVDCRQGRQNIYNATGAIQNTLRKRGSFFKIPIGRSGVTFTGNVRKVTIRPNWRYKV